MFPEDRTELTCVSVSFIDITWVIALIMLYSMDSGNQSTRIYIRAQADELFASFTLPLKMGIPGLPYFVALRIKSNECVLRHLELRVQ